MFRRIGRAFKEAWWGLTQHFAMAFSTANAVTLTLILVVVFTTLVSNISQITMDVEEDIQIYAPISSTVTVNDETIASLKNQIEKIPGVVAVEFSDKDAELEYFINSFENDGSIFEIYRGEDNPLPDAFLINIGSGYSISQVSAQVALIEGLDQAQYGGATVEDFIELLNGVRMVGYIFTAALTLLAIFLIHNTIRITINSRSKELAIMRLCGATNSYIRAPLVLEGIIIGVMGAILPILLTVFGYNYIYNAMGGQLISGLLRLLPVYPLVLYVSLFALGIGVLVGLIGSYVSASRYLRVQR